MWVCWDTGALLGQSRTVNIPCCVLLWAVQSMEDLGICCPMASHPCPLASSGVPSTPLPRESWLRNSVSTAAQGHGSQPWLGSAELRSTNTCFGLLSQQALAHPCPAALSSPAPRDGPELGPASLRGQALCAAPVHLRPGCCGRPSLQAGEHTQDHRGGAHRGPTQPLHLPWI